MNNQSVIKHNDEIYNALAKLGDEFVFINNPDYVHSKFDICPVAPKITNNPDEIVAIVQDMDGTTTTTENLCLHSLENMVREFTGLLTKEQWNGLDPERDYPHIIGNSTTKHVEYLIKGYQSRFDAKNFGQAYLKAALRTLCTGRDEIRKREVRQTLAHFGCRDIIHEKAVQAWFRAGSDDVAFFQHEDIKKLINHYANRLQFNDKISQVRAAIDVYYQRYHEILAGIEIGNIEALQSFVPNQNVNMIEPMPGVAVFLATIKGWLGEEARLFYDQLAEILKRNPQVEFSNIQQDRGRERLKQIGKYFESHPAKAAIVTSSIAYEAKIVLTEVFKIINQQIREWDVSDKRRNDLSKKFSELHHVFDAIITASDSSEIRLKPHRDLYSLALHQLGISKKDYTRVVGFEDSESGLISIRAAGIGLCVAVPFADTQGHNLSYASHILKGGLPEALLKHDAFLSEKTLDLH